MNQQEFEEWCIKWNGATEAFATKHELVPTQRLHEEGLAARWAIYGMDLLRQGLSQITDLDSRSPAWGLLYAAIERVFVHAEASVVALATGSFVTAEVIARATVEAVINVRYFLNDRPFERIFDYFSDYVIRERREIRQWQDLLGGMNDEDRRISNEAIQQKTSALDNYDRILRQVAEHILPQVNGKPVIYQAQPWPNILQRFRALGEEYAYRTVYAALSSQAHNDAEDLLNRYIIGVTRDKRLIQALVEENEKFARMVTYNSITMALEAAKAFAKYMEMEDAVKELALGERDMNTASHVSVPQGWGGQESLNEGTAP